MEKLVELEIELTFRAKPSAGGKIHACMHENTGRLVILIVV